MTEDYPLLSKSSILMLLCRSIGDEGILDSPAKDRLVFFLSLDCKYGSPSAIRREMKRALNLGYITVNGKDSKVMLSDQGRAEMKERGISIKSFFNNKMLKVKDLEKKANNTDNLMKKEEFMRRSKAIKNEIDKEGLLWTPPEWKNIGVPDDEKPVVNRRVNAGKSTVIVTTSTIGTVPGRAPPKPRKLK
jgi:hypothetical protein